MRQAVRDNFLPFSRPFEGRMPWMYLDTHLPPLVTVGVGNLIDPLKEALGLPFRWIHDDSLASPAQIAVEWTATKGRVALSEEVWTVWGKVANLYLNEGAIDALVLSRLSEDDAVLRGRFPAWEAWPADAQLATLSMAWAMGPNFAYPRWECAARAQDFATCAQECYIPDGKNLGLVPRNAANKFLFGVASNSQKFGTSYAEIHCPVGGFLGKTK